MKILLVSEFYPPVVGGLEYHVQGLARELARRQHEVHVATLGERNYQTSDGGIPVHHMRSLAARVPGMHSDRSRPFHLPVADPEVRHHLVRLLDRVEPDVIHAHNWMISSVPRRSAPVVLTAHDYSWICPKRTLLRPGGTVCPGPSLGRCTSCGREQYGLARSLATDLATRRGRATVRPAAHVAVSTAVAVALAPYTQSQPIVIPNFVDPDIVDMPDVEVPGLPDAQFVLFAGAALPHKGIDVLLRAWEPTPRPCQLVVAGLQAGARQWPPFVHVVTLTRSQMITAWRRAAVAVVPSVWAEPCPTVAIEAMAQGTPVVGSDIGGLRDIVQTGISGILVAPGDSNALRHAIEALVLDPARRAALGDAARCQAREWMLPEVVTVLESLYRKVTQEERPNVPA